MRGREGAALAPMRAGLPIPPTLAAGVVDRLGGRISAAMGIDVDAGDAEVERWFLAVTLLGPHVTASVARRRLSVLEDAGIHRIADVAGRPAGQLVPLLDAGGAARHVVQAAARLHALADQVARDGGAVATLGMQCTTADALADALDALPGWGPVTVGLFLRELRGVWPGACPPLDRHAAEAGRHLGLLGDQDDPLTRLTLVARLSHCDLRDLEGALVRLARAHRRAGRCPGGRGCTVLAPETAWARQAPAAGVRSVRLPGHRQIVIRPMRRDDGPGLVALYAGLSDADTYRRFFTAQPPPRSFVMTMAAEAQQGASGLVATLGEDRGPRDPHTAGGPTGGARADTGWREPGRIVAEATYALRTDGDAELGITVAREARGWLGPYLLDALCERAAAQWVPNLHAEVLMANAPMLAMLRRRGEAVTGFDTQPAIVRVVIGTVGSSPSWPGVHRARRLLVEAPGGRWRGDAAARAAGFDVMACPSPPGGWQACPAATGWPCPLAVDADVIVDAVPGDAGLSLRAAHRRTHPLVPVCAGLDPWPRR